MAILKKRTSSKQIPDAKALNRAPLSSVINSVGNRPNVSGGTSNSITSVGGSKPSLTTSTTSNPSITNNSSSTTKPTLTTSTTGAPKQTLTSTSKPSNSTTNKVMTALTGAALGAGTKLIIDKITGKPSVVKTGPTGSGGTGAPSGGTKKPAGGTTSTTGGTKTPAGGTTAPTGGTKNPAPTGGTKPPAGGTKPPAGGTTPPVTPKSGSSSPTSVIKNPATGLPVGTGFGDEQPKFTTDSLGNTYKTMPDGTSVLYRAAEVDEDIESPSTGGGTRGLGGNTETPTTDDTTGGNDAQYFQDEDGNIYVMNADGEYDLYRAAEVDEFPEDGSSEGDTYFAGDIWEDPDTGEVWTLGDGGMWTLDGDDEFGGDDSLFADTELPTDEDFLLAGDEEPIGNDDFYLNDNYYAGNDSYGGDEYYGGDDYASYDYGDYDYAKRGGLITMMKKGGVPKFANGNLVDDDGFTTNFAINEEDGGLYRPMGRNEYDEGYTPVLSNQGYLRNLALGDDEELMDDELLATTTSGGDDFTPVLGRQYFDDGSYIDTFDDGSTMTYDYDGNLVDTTDGYQTTRDDEGNYIVTDGYGNMTVYDPSGSVIPLGGGRVNAGPITNVGGGNREQKVGNVLNPNRDGETGYIGSDLLDKFTGALGTTAGAAGAGALFASLLGSDFGSGSSMNQGLDMSQVGVINPRTTDFGIGPTKYVGYEDYGTSGGDYTPNEELLRNLNAPGFNPVREGDYGYEEAPAQAATEEAPKMASGGLSSMATPVSSYYTFGQPADILANLGMRAQPPMNPPEMMPQIGQQQQPQQTQQQGLPQQAPPQMAQQMPQGMPQQGIMPQQQGMPPPMRKGGLPHASNVPMVEGRMDFRKGAAVHGAGDGQSDDIPAMLADGEYVIDAETVAQIGNGSTKAGAQALDKFREGIRAHKRSAPLNKIPPKTKPLTSYLKGAK